MRLTKHQTTTGPRWLADGALLAPGFSLGLLAQASDPHQLIQACLVGGAVGETTLLSPIDDNQEVWAAGVTYLRSKDARIDESDIGARLYQHIYESERPELFFKSPGYRCVTHGQPIRVRRDSDWDVPEPEMTLFINSRMQILGYTAGNDVSSRSIEGENALYLPQAKIFDGCAAIGTGIQLVDPVAVTDLPIQMTIRRGGETIYDDQTSSAKMKQKPADLADWVGRELSFPRGLLMMTGTGIVPGSGFTLRPGDEVRISVGSETLVNPVA